ncbi:hypothetical protein TIFTF001_033519 [Ficus carica]|uniref:Uncharacterized protein n=1 Tax=Ficus carica TaxID=3494 RepID=A0AA88J9A1_FICCA|nr:hypothetical protein TIFTF001_033519 [Ficus carica]
MWDCTAYPFLVGTDDCHNHSSFRGPTSSLTTLLVSFALGLTPKGLIPLRTGLFTYEPSHISITHRTPCPHGFTLGLTPNGLIPLRDEFGFHDVASTTVFKKRSWKVRQKHGAEHGFRKPSWKPRLPRRSSKTVVEARSFHDGF